MLPGFLPPACCPKVPCEQGRAVGLKQERDTDRRGMRCRVRAPHRSATRPNFRAIERNRFAPGFEIGSRRMARAQYFFDAHNSVRRTPCYGNRSGAPDLTEVSLAAAGERGGGKSAPQRAGSDGPAPLPSLLAAGSNALAPMGGAKAAIRPVAALLSPKRRRAPSRVFSGQTRRLGTSLIVDRGLICQIRCAEN